MFVIDRLRRSSGEGSRVPRRKRGGHTAALSHAGYTAIFFGIIRLIYLAKNSGGKE